MDRQVVHRVRLGALTLNCNGKKWQKMAKNGKKWQKMAKLRGRCCAVLSVRVWVRVLPIFCCAKLQWQKHKKA
jgi:hypothetical protein